MTTNNKVKKTALIFASTLYTLCVLSILLKFPEKMHYKMFFFIGFNFVLSLSYFCFLKSKKDSIFQHMIYMSFLLVYVIKAVIHYMTGLSSPYIVRTIKRVVTIDSYYDTLYVISLTHLFLVSTLLIIDKIKRKKSQIRCFKVSSKTYLQSLLFILIGISISSVIMYMFGVASMGTEGVKLPYRLSGIFFYGRTILIPLYLLCIIINALRTNNSFQFKSAIFCYLFLGINEVIVRSSKSPFLFILIHLCLIFTLIEVKVPAKYIPKKTTVLWGFLAIILSFPIIENYRDNRLDVQRTNDFNTKMSTVDFAYHAAERFSQRLLGVTQLSGIIDQEAQMQLPIKGQSIAHYYTSDILYLNTRSHLSSPSLIGTSYMISKNYYFLIFTCIIVFFYTVWILCEKIPFMGIAIKCFISTSLLNTMIAGTIDFFFSDVCLVFVCAIFIKKLIYSFSEKQPYKTSI